MSNILFSSETSITSDWITYVENEAKSLASSSDQFTIENYVDRELFNPEVQEYLESEFDETDEDFSDGGLSLSFAESKAISGQRPFLFGRWRRFKDKIRKVFCAVVGGFGDGDINWKDIISGVLVALIPVFAGGLPALVLPVVVGLVAMLMKYGLGQVCPAA